MTASRIPPIQALLAFEALARLRSVTLAAEELAVTPSAVSHRIRQLETQLGLKLFVRGDFSLGAEGSAYLARVREALAVLQQVPAGDRAGPAPVRLRLGVTPTFSRELLLPRLALFRHAYPEVELTLLVGVPGAGQMNPEADLEVSFGPAPLAGVESMMLMADEVSPVCSPDVLHALGPVDGFASTEALDAARLIRTPLEPWRTWFRACGIDRPEPTSGAQFNDLGLVLDAAVAGFGVALMRLRLGRAWLDSGRLVRLSPRSVPSPHAYHLGWKPGTLQRWECAAFVDWLRQALKS
ncbi:LysR substrate-binding domain-containing protein [Piscinibacter sakaiensis]|uniref:Glycine cleavage system transcriptional activator n=1 Tax=Piscinibacter sakaiensis TaxID=1547922 RepID=A0A0K8NYS8_PISS1|nr:LysR substrate-binding domain-containing protein [Piscinibacter sakaiensis]GAP35536.1 glycine cleavage system transcriptional activator [Piscinibacter sakaiensis]